MYDRSLLCGVLLTLLSAGSFADYYDCNEPLLDRAVLSATSSLVDRGPENARLNEGKSWTALDSDFEQALIVDLGQVMKVTGIETQGRAHTSEYVMEYGISYGYNGLDYAVYKEPSGNAKMFKGNINGEGIKRNKFEVPIIGQWIRINPTRWRDRISLRLELYGCDYVGENMYFNGSSLLKIDFKSEPISSTRESIRFRFKTNMADGVLMYSKGTQGDFFALQLRQNRMMFNIDLGSRLTTSLSVGSLLDDNIWHDVIISRNRRDIVFSVDRVVIHGRIKGDYIRLNLNRELYVGGVPNFQEGLKVSQNFSGCIENLFLNSTNVIYEVKEGYNNGDEELMHKYTKVNTLYSCLESHIIPVSFLTRSSYAKLKGYEGSNRLNVSVGFRTYEENGLLIFHKFLPKGFVKVFLQKGHIKVELQLPARGGGPYSTVQSTFLDNYNERFDDGRWHHCMLTISKDNLVLTVDQKPMPTLKEISIQTTSYYLIGGGIQGEPGFIGCMRLISVDGNYQLPTNWKEDEYCCKGEIVFDSCQMIDRCNPNPCEHGAVCTQSSFEFICNCQDTGYTGAVCHTSLNPLSCGSYKDSGEKASIKIDIDGSGPLAPFPVSCEYSDGRIITIVHHSNEEDTPVDGFQPPGSFSQDIIYDADMLQLEALTNRSISCTQYLYYKCRNARLFNSPSTEESFNPYSWWVSRNNKKMDYWGESVPGSRKCQCGIMGNCVDPTKWCNCDQGLDTWVADEGKLWDKNELPVRQLRFGDTGHPLDDKEGVYRLGPLICEGDDLFNNVVTFRISDASINLPTFDMGHSGDIFLEFKTTLLNGVILHSKGPSDFIKLAIIGGTKLQFTFQAGGGNLGVTVETTYILADDQWHSVSIERNRKEARLIVDSALKAEVRQPPGPVRAMHLTSPLVIGSTVEYRDGFTGCVRSLLLNGKLVDLKSYAEKGLYGVSVGCVGKCASNPCMNNGTCIERYDGYTCDCRWTAFKGPICADEIGVNLRSNSMVKYDFMGSWRSTLAESIRVGFTTTNPKGFLLGMFSSLTSEYMTISVSNSGHLRVVFDFGFERREAIFPNKHFGLGQYHDVRISRKNSGSTLVMLVDNYEPMEFHYEVKESADAQFNNIQYLYIGKNETMKEGFVGCISRVEFDDIYPLKLLFQEDGPSNVKSIGGNLNEDFCGVEPITHPPNIVETRPPPDIDEDKLAEIYSDTASAVIGGVVFAILLILLIVAFLIFRYVMRHKGEYLTQEDRGAEMALDPDEAVMESTTGHQVQKKKEWFI
ncbi:neurexin-4 isoform X1 [Cimex lectularius]|uniref:Neurexin-4 n=1 Tax=Cimex lectularius TaxID=79782 RepID=A0A8I6RHA2_CIMLE|nr:neurexin-4 isoform X1 [Cimex lectularius]